MQKNEVTKPKPERPENYMRDWMRAMRAEQKAKGLISALVWILPGQQEKVRKYAEKLVRKGKRDAGTT